MPLLKFIAQEIEVLLLFVVLGFEPRPLHVRQALCRAPPPTEKGLHLFIEMKLLKMLTSTYALVTVFVCNASRYNLRGVYCSYFWN